MGQAEKTNALRDVAFVRQYFSGKVIDIGAGDDLVCPNAERFDMEDGDANVISHYRTPGAYDCVHSSHCLEHMHDPKSALDHWWALVKPGGYLVTVVPHEDLYEQGYWPSIFNRDHKVTFTTRPGPSWSPVSHNIETLIGGLPGAELLGVEIQDRDYDYRLQRRARTSATNGRTLRRFLFKILRSVVKQVPVVGMSLRRKVEDAGFHIGVPVDQTTRAALAQIQVIARKATHCAPGTELPVPVTADDAATQ